MHISGDQIDITDGLSSAPAISGGNALVKFNTPEINAEDFYIRVTFAYEDSSRNISGWKNTVTARLTPSGTVGLDIVPMGGSYELYNGSWILSAGFIIPDSLNVNDPNFSISCYLEDGSGNDISLPAPEIEPYTAGGQNAMIVSFTLASGALEPSQNYTLSVYITYYDTVNNVTMEGNSTADIVPG